MFAFGGGGVQRLLFCRLQRFDFFAFRGDGLLGLFQRSFRGFDAALRIFSAHHDFQLAVFGFGDFRFGVGDFVLKRFVGFVGFYRTALFAVLLGAIFPLLHIEFEFFALGKAVGVGLTRGGDGVARAGQFQVGLANALGK